MSSMVVINNQSHKKKWLRQITLVAVAVVVVHCTL